MLYYAQYYANSKLGCTALLLCVLICEDVMRT